MSELTDPNEPDVTRLSRMVLAGEDVAEVEAKMVQEIYEQDIRRGMHPASPEALTYEHPNLAAEAFLRAEDTFNDLDTGIWRLERRRADLLRQYRDMVAGRRPPPRDI